MFTHAGRWTPTKNLVHMLKLIMQHTGKREWKVVICIIDNSGEQGRLLKQALNGLSKLGKETGLFLFCFVLFCFIMVKGWVSEVMCTKWGLHGLNTHPPPYLRKRHLDIDLSSYMTQGSRKQWGIKVVTRQRRAKQKREFLQYFLVFIMRNYPQIALEYVRNSFIKLNNIPGIPGKL